MRHIGMQFGKESAANLASCPNAGESRMKNDKLASPHEIFADGMETVHILNGTARLDLFTLQPPRDGSQPGPEIGDRIIMPLHGFLQMYETLGKAVGKLVQDGVLQAGKPDNNSWDIQN